MSTETDFPSGQSPEPIRLKFKKAHPDVQSPKFASKGAAAFDICAFPTDEKQTVLPKQSIEFQTGLSFEIPEGFYIEMHSRSGHGFKHGLRLVNSQGVIDTDYRGDVGVKLFNDSNLPYEFTKNERIAQCILKRKEDVVLIEATELSETERGAGGFGSTGKA